MVDAAQIRARSSIEVAITPNIQPADLRREILLKLRNRFQLGESVPQDENIEIKAKYLSSEYREGLSGEARFRIDTSEDLNYLETAPISPASALRFNLRDVRALLLSAQRILRRNHGSELQKNWSKWSSLFGTDLTAGQVRLEKTPLQEVLNELIEATTEVLGEAPEPAETESELELPEWLEKLIEETRTTEEVVKGWNNGVQAVVEATNQAINRLPAGSNLTGLTIASSIEPLEFRVVWQFFNLWLNAIYDHTFLINPPARPSGLFAPELLPLQLTTGDIQQVEFLNQRLANWIQELKEALRLQELLREGKPSDQASAEEQTAQTAEAGEAEGSQAETDGTDTETGESESTTTESEPPPTGPGPTATEGPEPTSGPTPGGNTGPTPGSQTPSGSAPSPGNTEEPVLKTTQQLYDFYKSNDRSFTTELERYRVALLPALLEINGINLGKGNLSLQQLQQLYPSEYEAIRYWFAEEVKGHLSKILTEDPSKLGSLNGQLSILTALQRHLLSTNISVQLEGSINRLKPIIPQAVDVPFAENQAKLDEYLQAHPVSQDSVQFLAKASFLTGTSPEVFLSQLTELGISQPDQEKIIKNFALFVTQGEAAERILALNQADIESFFGVIIPSSVQGEQLNKLQFLMTQYLNTYARSAADRMGYDSISRPDPRAWSRADQKFSAEERASNQANAELAEAAQLAGDQLMATIAMSQAEYEDTFARRMSAEEAQFLRNLTESFLAQAEMLARSASQADIAQRIDEIYSQGSLALTNNVGLRDLQTGYAADGNGRRLPSLKTLRNVKKAAQFVKKGVDLAAKATDAAVTAAIASTGVGAGYAFIPEPIRKYLSSGIALLLAGAISKIASLIGGLGGSIFGGAAAGAGIGAVLGFGVPGAVVGGIIGGALGGGAYLLGQGGAGGGVGSSALSLGGPNVPGLVSNFLGNGALPTSTPTPVIGGLAPAQAVTAVGLAVTTAAAVLSTQSGAFLAPENFSDNLGDVSKYVTISKIATPSKLDNNQNANVNYTITITPKENYEIQISDLTDTFSYLGCKTGEAPCSSYNFLSPTLDFKAKAPGKISKDTPITFDYTVPMKGTNVLVVNTVTLKFTAFEGEKLLTAQEGETAKMTAQVRIGNPEVGCFEFVDTVGEQFYDPNAITKAWNEDEKNKVLTAFSAHAGSNSSFQSLICNAGTIKLYRLDGYAFGGFAPGAAKGEKLGLYDGAFGNKEGLVYGPGSIEYTLIHELGHIADYRNPGLISGFLKLWSGSCYTYPAGPNNKCTGYEAFAEGNTLYVVSSTYPQVGSYNFKGTHNNEYNWYKENMYGNVEY